MLDENKILEIIEECKKYDTKDLQNDLALILGDKDEYEEAYKRILISRCEKLPVNCKFIYNQYAPYKSELKFELIWNSLFIVIIERS